MIMTPIQPCHYCDRCPRLSNFLQEQRLQYPDWHNGPVSPFLPQGLEPLLQVKMLIVGLAPGLKGANRTGRPFTGDYAGELLYSTLCHFGFAKGEFAARHDDGLQLCETAIINAVRCVPPANKPLGSEIRQCRVFLESFVQHLPNLQLIVALGKVAHESVVSTLGKKVTHYPFKHGVSYQFESLRLLSSYHCSRYNTNTRVLTPAMFHYIFLQAREFLI